MQGVRDLLARPQANFSSRAGATSQCRKQRTAVLHMDADSLICVAGIHTGTLGIPQHVAQASEPLLPSYIKVPVSLLLLLEHFAHAGTIKPVFSLWSEHIGQAICSNMDRRMCRMGFQHGGVGRRDPAHSLGPFNDRLEVYWRVASNRSGAGIFFSTQQSSHDLK